MYRFLFAKVNAREFLTRFSKYFVLFFMHVNGCQCWYFVWDMHVVFLPSCSMNKTVLQYSRTVEDRLVTKVSWKTSCVKLRTEIQNRRFLFQPLKVSFSITIFSWRMYIQSDSAAHHDKPITLTDFFLCSRGYAIFLFCWKICACFETFFRRIEKKKKTHYIWRESKTRWILILWCSKQFLDSHPSEQRLKWCSAPVLAHALSGHINPWQPSKHCGPIPPHVTLR